MLWKIFKNSTYLLIAQALIKVIALFYTIFLARQLGVSNFGLLTAALAYFALVSSISDLGFNRFLIREGAKDFKKLPSYVTIAVFVRFTLTAIIFALFALWLSNFDKDAQRISLSVMAVLTILPQSVSLTFDSALIASQKLGLSAAGLLVLSFVTTVVGVFLVQSGFSTYGAVSALVIGQLVYLVFLFWILMRNQLISFKQFLEAEIREIVKGSIPYWALGILGLLYFRVDTLLLSYLKGSYDTGIYGAGYKFLEAIVFVPSALSSALFPVFANLAEKNPKKLYLIYKKTLIISLLVSLVVAAVYLTLLPAIILKFLPQYAQSVIVINILTLTIPFLFMISPQSLVLLSHKRYLNPLIIMSVFNLLLNLILNLIFIPSYSFLASAWITVISDVVGFTIFLVYIHYQFRKFN